MVLSDGVPINKYDLRRANWNRIILASINKIDISKCPNSSVYRSNAIGGLINIITVFEDSWDNVFINLNYGLTLSGMISESCLMHH